MENIVFNGDINDKVLVLDFLKFSALFLLCKTESI